MFQNIKHKIKFGGYIYQRFQSMSIKESSSYEIFELRACTRIEPVTSRTLSENHTARPESRQQLPVHPTIFYENNCKTKSMTTSKGDRGSTFSLSSEAAINSCFCYDVQVMHILGKTMFRNYLFFICIFQTSHCEITLNILLLS